MNTYWVLPQFLTDDRHLSIPNIPHKYKREEFKEYNLFEEIEQEKGGGSAVLSAYHNRGADMLLKEKASRGGMGLFGEEEGESEGRVRVQGAVRHMNTVINRLWGKVEGGGGTAIGGGQGSGYLGMWERRGNMLRDMKGLNGILYIVYIYILYIRDWELYAA